MSFFGVRSIGIVEVTAALRRGVAVADQQTKEVVRTGSLELRKKLVRRMGGIGLNDPFWGKQGAGGSYLGVRTGQTRARISPGGIVFKTLNGYRAEVGSPDKYVSFLERGGTISGNPFLRIATGAALTAAGALKEEFARATWRGIPGVFVWKNKNTGNLWLARSREGKLELLALLKRSVNLRGRDIFLITAAEMRIDMRERGAVAANAIVQASH